MNTIVNGALEIDASSGPVIFHNTSSDPLNGGYDWKLYYAPGQWTNGSSSEPIYIDDVWAFGINMAGVGTAADPTKVCAAWHMESKFYENSSRSSPYVEYFLETIDTTGGIRRPIGGVSSYDGTFDNLTLASSLLVFEDHQANPRVSFDFRAGNQCTVFNGLCFTYLQNNTAIARQEIADGTSSVALPYIDDAGNTVVSAPITTPASEGNASGPVFTSRGTNTTALTAQAPGANAATFQLSCQTGASAKSGQMGIDANGNLVFAQVSTSGGLFFDFNGYIYFRDRTNNYAQAIAVSPAAVSFNIPVRVPNYTVATAPSASSAGNGALIYVTNGDAGSPCLAASDGTNLRRISLGANISSS
jgi:hypothetical protein